MSREILDTRKKILEAAWKLLEESHGQDVRMSDIAAAAGVSRQAVYLHFENRADLLIAVTHYVDEVSGLDKRLEQYRAATNGVDILDDFVEFWGNYIPVIYGVAKALIALKETDEAAAAAWSDRMNAIRSGCRRSIEAINHDGMLGSEWSIDEAVDLTWTILAVRNWEQLTVGCNWPIEKYISRIQRTLKNTLLRR